MKLTIPASLSINMNMISALAISDMYTANSGLYCFMIIIIITAVRAMPIIFIISIFLLPFLLDLQVKHGSY